MIWDLTCTCFASANFRQERFVMGGCVSWRTSMGSDDPLFPVRHIDLVFLRLEKLCSDRRDCGSTGERNGSRENGKGGFVKGREGKTCTIIVSTNAYKISPSENALLYRQKLDFGARYFLRSSLVWFLYFFSSSNKLYTNHECLSLYTRIPHRYSGYS